MPEHLAPPPHGATVRRRARVLLTLLALGVFTTIVVAWAAAVLVRVPHPNYARSERQRVRARVYLDLPPRTLGIAARSSIVRSRTVEGNYTEFGKPSVWVTRWSGPASSYFSSGTDAGLSPRAAGTAPMDSLVSRDLRPIVAPWLTGDAPWPYSEATRYTGARGWPWRAVWCEFLTTPGAPWTGRPAGGIELPRPRVSPGHYLPPPPRSALPYRPLWRGFAADTAFYVALWGLVIVAGRKARRGRRRRAGLCVACGYDLRGTPGGSRCPECGAGLDPRRGMLGS